MIRPRALLTPLAALLLAVAAGCGGGSAAPGTSGAGTSGAGVPGAGVPGAGATGGCAAPSIAASSYLADSIAVDGTDRTYHLATPAGDPRKARALVLVFHGAGGEGDRIRGTLGKPMESAAADEAVFVYPDGLADGGATGWPDSGGRDVAFVDALLAKLAGQICYDTARVFATGFSYGGYMSNTLGCARAGVVRAIAPLSGEGPWRACNGQPVAAWIAHGTSDPTVDASQGEGSRDHWLSTNGCAATSQAVSPSPCQSYDGCGANPVVWCAFPGVHAVESWEPPAVWSFFASLR